MPYNEVQEKGSRDTRESETSQANGSPASGAGTGAPLRIDTTRRLGRGLLVAALAVALVLAVFIFAGIRSRLHAEDELANATRQDAVLSVAVTTPAQSSKPLEITLPADTQAYIDTPIYARTNGYLLHWYADIGAHVHKGEILAVIQAPELDQQVDQARSELATAQANFQIAKITADRWSRLLAKNAVSRQEADQAASDFNARSSALASAQANLRRLQQLQSYEKVYAPFDGIITARNVDIGSLIQAGDSNTPQAQLFHMAATDKLRLYVPVPEVYAENVHNGGRVEITSDADPNHKFYGTIVRNSDAIDLSTRTLNVEVDVDNRDHKLLPGQYAFVHLLIPPSDASMTLPSNTLLFRSEGLRVGVVKNDRVQLVPVQIGHDYGAKVEIISGLSPQDQVILNPSDSLAAGERVRIEKGIGE